MVAVRQGEAKPDQHRDREEVVRTLRLRRTGSISSEETVSRRVRVREVARGGTGLNQTFMVMTDHTNRYTLIDFRFARQSLPDPRAKSE